MVKDTYSVSQVARIVGIAPNTVRDWTRKFEIEAQTEVDAERRYSPEDVALLRTVKVLRDQGEPMKRIMPRIAEGERLEPPEGPPDPPELPRDAPASDTALVSQAQAEVSRYRGKIEAVEDERTRLVSQLDDERTALQAMTERAVKAETMLEMVGSSAGQVTSPEGESKPPAWQFWRRG